MPKSKDEIPEFLPTSPISWLCPTCMSMPGHDCITNSGGFAAIHVARMKAAALAGETMPEKQLSGNAGHLNGSAQH